MGEGEEEGRKGKKIEEGSRKGGGIEKREGEKRG